MKCSSFHEIEAKIIFGALIGGNTWDCVVLCFEIE